LPAACADAARTAISRCRAKVREPSARDVHARDNITSPTAPHNTSTVSEHLPPAVCAAASLQLRQRQRFFCPAPTLARDQLNSVCAPEGCAWFETADDVDQLKRIALSFLNGSSASGSQTSNSPGKRKLFGITPTIE
jgi:hypothetical protein